MAPNIDSKGQDEITNIEDKLNEEKPTIASPWKHEYIYRNIIFFIYCYIAGTYGMYLSIVSAKWTTIISNVIFFNIATLGITAGAHRLFAHKTYKASRPLQVLLMVCHSVAYQRTLVTWVRDHRLHHKYSDTDADPHNPSRGIFFSHLGWLLVKSHPEVLRRKKNIDMSDVFGNPVLMFQKRHAAWFLPLVGFIIPTTIPWLLGDTFSNSWHLNIFRYMLNSNITFLTNSLAHSLGYHRPYDKTMSACQNMPLIVITFGEGFHNYHHAFPWDYRTAELGNNKLNYVTTIIDFFARIGWAYDLKTAPDDMIKNRVLRTGDGTDLWGSEIKVKNLLLQPITVPLLGTGLLSE